MAKKKAAKKKSPAKKSAPRKKPGKVIDEPVKSVYYKQGDLLDGFEVIREAAERTKKKDPMPFDIKWETADSEITLHVMGAVELEEKKRK